MASDAQRTAGRPWFRHKTVAIPLPAFLALFVVGLFGSIVEPPQSTLVTTSAASASPTSSSSSVVATPPAFPDQRTKTALCQLRGALPDHGCTPGALNPAVTQANVAQTICVAGYTATIRPSSTESQRLKREAATAYGITDPIANYEGDHLIPLELGGAPRGLSNFWDQPHRVVLGDGTFATSTQKDTLENRLKAQVCAQQMTLLEAQRQIASDWYRAAAARPATTTTTTTSRSES